MLYALGVLVALQIVSAQTCWKIGLEKQGFVPKPEFLFSSHMLSVLFSPFILLGALLYLSATLLFFVMLSKYEYSNTQTLVVIASLTFSFFSAAIFFNEKIHPVNLIGIALLFVGVVLITRF